MKHWIKAFRLRTLPLALSCVGLGSFLAASKDSFSWLVLALCFVTTLFLQILSNLANDYGDGIKGTDNDDRVGPQRAIQSGAISVKQMKTAVIIFSILSGVSALTTAIIGTWGLPFYVPLLFIGLAVLAVIAAITYTVGKSAYGYKGLGDVFVFIFFGLTGVVGSYYLHTHALNWEVFMPAAALGMLTVGVLNLNNMRDIENDRNSGKKTLVVMMGGKNAKLYHAFLIFGALVLASGYMFLNYETPQQFLFLMLTPLFAKNVRTVLNNSKPADLDPLLKKLAISTFLFVLFYGFCLVKWT